MKSFRIQLASESKLIKSSYNLSGWIKAGLVFGLSTGTFLLAKSTGVWSWIAGCGRNPEKSSLAQESTTVSIQSNSLCAIEQFDSTLSFSNTLLCGAGLGLNALSMVVNQEINPLLLGTSALWCASPALAQAVWQSPVALGSLNGITGFILDGESFDMSGSWVSKAGDVNGDGVDDIIIGAPSASPEGRSQAGQSYVIFGNSGGWSSIIDLTMLNGANGFKIYGDVGDGDYYTGVVSGTSVSQAGDLNGDRFDDIAIGAPGIWAFELGSGIGCTFVIFGHNGTWTSSLDLRTLNGSNGFKLCGQTVGDMIGWSVKQAGDVNGDNIDDIIIGDPQASPDGKTHAGRSYVVFGNSIGNWNSTIDLTTLNGTMGFRMDGESANSQNGFSVSCAGDLNNDGIDDVIICAPGVGKSYVIFGQNSYWEWTNPFDLSIMNGTIGFQLVGGCWSVSQAGDINDDGIDDIIIGDRGGGGGGYDSLGRSYVVFGYKGSWNSSLDITTLNGVNGFMLYGETTGDWSGYSVSQAGDINDDGIDDIIIGAMSSYNGAGKSYVVFGHIGNWNNPIALATLNGINGFKLYGEIFVDGGGQDGGQSGWPVSQAGDINGDNVDDIIIGSHYASPEGRPQAGRSYVVFGNSIYVGNLLASQAGCCVVSVGQIYNFTFVAGSFASINSNLTYIATRSDNTALPSWLSFMQATRTFSGMPVAADIGFLNIKVTATVRLVSISQTFSLNVTQSLSATNIAQAITYTEDQSYNLAGIVIITPGSTTTAKLTLSDATAGSLTVATSGSVTSTYNTATGVWQASGNVANVNVLLANLKFQPAIHSYKNFNILVNIADAYGQSLISTINAVGTEFNYPPTVGTLISSQSGCCAIGIGQPYSFTFVAASFTDINGGDIFTYNATRGDNTALPNWLSFTPATRTFSGMLVSASNIGSLSLKVTAIDTKWGMFVAQSFPLNITQSLSATNLVQTISYLENTYYNLTDIVVTTPSPTITAKLTLSDVIAGALTVATSGSVTSTYNAATGVWQASGDITNVNALLAGIKFQPATYSYKNFNVGVNITDSYGQSLSSTINAIGSAASPPVIGTLIATQSGCCAIGIGQPYSFTFTSAIPA